METTITTTKVTAEASAQAVATINEYRANGYGSNRTNWERVVGVLSAVITAVKTGHAVDITELFAKNDGKAPAYHLAHRALSAGVVRPEWQNVQVVTIRTAGIKIARNGDVSGDTTTTGKVGTVRVYIAPVA